MTKFETRLRQSAYFRLAIAAIILVLVGVFIVYPGYREFNEKRILVTTLQTKIKTIDNALNTERNKYRLLKADYTAKAAVSQKTVETVLPSLPNRTDIVREIEEYSNQFADNETFELKVINFGKATQNKDADYTTIALKIGFSSTKENLLKFLHHLENTGNTSVTTEQASRLLDVKDINIQTQNKNSAENNEVEIINVELSINAYALPEIQET